MIRRSFVLFLLFSTVAGLCGTGHAQTVSADQLYGQGIHAFNANQYREAIAAFDQVEKLRTPDPRVFFYRGLAYARLNDSEKSVKDFEYASRLEQTTAASAYSVPKALERIQGKERATIEQYRREAKRIWEAEAAKRRQETFLAQKTQNQQFYNKIISSGEQAKATADTAATDVNTPIPFGAKAITPFTSEANAVSGGLRLQYTKKNVFTEHVETPTVINNEEPEPIKTAPKKSVDPFDNLDTDANAIKGFDDVDLSAGNSTVNLGDGIFNVFGDATANPTNDAANTSAARDLFNETFENNDLSTPNNPFSNDSAVEALDFPDSSMSPTTLPDGVRFQPKADAKTAGNSFGKTLGSLFKKSDKKASSPEVPIPTFIPTVAPEATPQDENIFDDNAIETPTTPI
ncbi:MAG: hypothetical protein LBJ67_17450 [Planctomycetaceae bacterium]|jgi:tetratricopeptide (TPR) repeat protein|nr:hypothetical protein [Planctomycetaceae bacterium]